jgi:glutamate-1-semialdehyde 2,1-aminomutase
VIPSAEDVRYGKNGSDACAGAVRLARHLTGREKIIYRGYHGFHDWYFASTTCPGIPAALKQTLVSQADLTPREVDATFRRHKDQIAAIIMNPLTPPVPSTDGIREIIEIVHRHGALVIFDEMLSGFRVALGGMQEIWGVKPDLSCFGKSIANGLPLSVLCGRADYIRRLPETYYGMTFEGEAVSIAAAHATLTEVVEKRVVNALFETGRRIRAAYENTAASCGVRTSLTGYEPCMAMEFDDQHGVPGRQLLWLMNQELTRNRIFTLGAFVLCFSHGKRELRRLEQALDSAMSIVRRAVERGSTEGLLDQRVRERMDDITAPANWRRAE